MSSIYTSVDQLIGNTPLLELKNIEKQFGLRARLLAKLEYLNPAGSVKDRVALAMINDAEAAGKLRPGAVIIEPTSGNTGIGLAAVAAARGYRMMLVMPDTMSVERRLLAAAYGAELVLTPGAEGMKGAIAKAEELSKTMQNSFIPSQFENPSNPMAHYITTAPEIWEATEGKVDAFVAGVGTGGTLSGVAKYLKEPRRAVKAAVNSDFRLNNFVEDDRALRMTANQAEDIVDRLNAEEQYMVESSATQLFNNVKFKKEIDKANEDVHVSISQRMSKKKTLLIGCIVLVAYLIGFLPLVFRNLSTEKAVLCALAVTCGAVLILAVFGIVTLVMMRKKHLKAYDAFNAKMSEICVEIEDGLRDFSTYLSHACNVMRASSVLQTRESQSSKEQKILTYHAVRVSEKTKDAYELFSKYIDCNSVTVSDVEPYLYDYTVMRDYNFDMPYKESKKKIAFGQEDNMVVIPVDYVSSVILVREELYG